MSPEREVVYRTPRKCFINIKNRNTDYTPQLQPLPKFGNKTHFCPYHLVFLFHCLVKSSLLFCIGIPPTTIGNSKHRGETDSNCSELVTQNSPESTVGVPFFKISCIIISCVHFLSLVGGFFSLRIHCCFASPKRI